MVLRVSARPLTFVSHLLAIAATVMVLVWCIHFRGGLAFKATNKSLIFNIHPVVMLIGFIILGGEAIISYKVFPWRKKVKKVIHLTLHFFTLILGIVGIYAAFKYHSESGIANLYSLHSWIGIATICLYGIQWIYGFMVFMYPGGSSAVRGGSLPWHVLFGTLVYMLGLGTAALGFLEKLTFLESLGLYKYGPEAYLVNFTALVMILFGALVVLSVISPAHVQHHFTYSSL